MTKDEFFESKEGKEMTSKLHILRRDTILRKEQMYSREILEVLLPIIKPTLVWEERLDEDWGPNFISEARGFKFTVNMKFSEPLIRVYETFMNHPLTTLSNFGIEMEEQAKQLCQDWLDKH